MVEISQYKKVVNFYDNHDNHKKEYYQYQDILSLEQFKRAKKEIHTWSGYKRTPLHELEEFAKQTKVSKIYYKDESHRFGLKCFKALGGAYAVANLLIEELKKKVSMQHPKTY